EGLTKRSAVGFLLRSLIMFQTFISRHNSNFFSDKLVLTSVTPASSAPVLQTPKATSSTLYFDSLTVNAGNGGFLSNIGISQSTFSVKVLNLFSRSRRKTNKRKSKHSAMLRNKETRHRMFIGLLNTT